MFVSGLLSAMAILISPEPLTLQQVSFPTGVVSAWTGRYSDLSSTASSLGGLGGSPLTLPTLAPSPASVRSSFSNMMRARDVFDLSGHQTRVVAKLFRLDGAGQRTATACTAQFVGPRHLITAAHCIIRRDTGQPHAGFEIALRYDDGEDRGVIPVIAAWAPSSEAKARGNVVQTDTAYDPGAHCSDFALIEIAEPAGRELGWLGMTADVDTGELLHRFSYPHQSAADILQAQLDAGGQPDQVKTILRQEIARLRRLEPDFSPTNLYYEYGVPDDVRPGVLSEQNGAVLPGRSGSAMVDGESRIAAVMSSATNGVNSSCRLTPSVVGAFAVIAGVAEAA